MYKPIHIFIYIAAVILGSLISTAQEVKSYDFLDEAIESEIEGIDFSGLDDIGDMSIHGETIVDFKVMTEFVRRYNPDFEESIAEAYITIGKRYGIRGDVAFCQAILETGWFRFNDGTAVRPGNHNYCGLGVVRRGVEGARFKTIDEGVTAHIQHLFAYASDRQIPKGEKIVDPRFSAVRRGIAPSWSDLNNRWAMNPVYGQKILKIYTDLCSFSSPK